MFDDFSKYNDEQLLDHITMVSKKLLVANPNYPVYYQLQDYLGQARQEYSDRIALGIARKEIEEGDQVITIGEGESQVDPDPIPEEEREQMRLTALTKLLAQSYVYDRKK